MCIWVKKTIPKYPQTKRTIGHGIMCVWVNKTILKCSGTKRPIGHGIMCIWVDTSFSSVLGQLDIRLCAYGLIHHFQVSQDKKDNWTWDYVHMGDEDHSQVSQDKKDNWTWDYVHMGKHMGKEDHLGMKKTIGHWDYARMSE